MGQVHLYDYSDQSGARAVNEQGLKALTLTGFSSADASHTYHHSKTLNTDGQAYPYPTCLLYTSVRLAGGDAGRHR